MWDLDLEIAVWYCLGLIYVLARFHHQVVEWAHTMPALGHPGIIFTLETIRRKYWWPQMAHDIARAVKSYCMFQKASSSYLAGRGPQYVLQV